MTVTDPVIARIAHEDPVQWSHLSPDADSEAARILERILRSAPDAQAHTWLRPPRGVRSLLAPALGIAIAVIVALVALASTRHHAQPAGAAGVPAGARQLVEKLAVLRRPQTRADRLPQSVSAELKTSAFGSAAIPSLTRLAATVNGGAGRPGGESIYLIIGTPRGYHVDIATALVVTGAPGHRYLVTPPEVVEEQTAIQTRGLTPTAVAPDNSYELCGATWCKSQPLPGRGVTVAVVPNGVNRVKWVFKRAYRRFSPPSGPAVTVYPHVQNNVAVATTYELEGLFNATWYGSDGHVIASLSPSAQQAAEQAQALAASERQPIAPVLIKHFAVFRRPVPLPGMIKPLPHSFAVAITNQGFGLNVDQARFVPYPGSSGEWVIPGAHGVSLAAQLPCQRRSRRPICGGFAGGDAPTSMVLSGRMIGASFGASGETVNGLAPDGNSSVTILLAHGARRTIPVIDNVYSLTIPPQAVKVIMSNAARHEVTISAP